MKSKNILVLVILCAVLAGGALLFALKSIDGMYAHRSPLRDMPPAPGEVLGTRKAERLVIVLIDGLRYDTAQDAAVMPNLAALRAQGASARMMSEAPSFSMPGYAVLLTGAGPDTSDGPAVNVDYDDIWTITQDTLFGAAKRAGLTTGIAGYYWFEKLVPQEAVDLKFYTEGYDQQADRDVVDAALGWLRARDGDLVLVHLDQVDTAGHYEGGPQDQRWNEAAGRADGLLGEIVGAVDLGKDAVMVVSDHGHILRGGHGGHDADALLEPFVLAGAGVRPGEFAYVSMVDAAPTALALLGTSLPASAWGQPLEMMLELDESEQRALRMAERAQKAELERLYRRAIGASEEMSGLLAARAEREAAERMPRLALTVGILVAAAGLLVWRRPAGLGWLAVGAAAAAGIFYLYYCGVEGRPVSLSAVDSQGQLLGSAGLGAFLGLAGGGLLAGRMLKRLGDPGFWCELGLATGLLAGLPVLWSYLLNGMTANFALPDIGSAFAGVLASLHSAFSAILGLAAAGIATGIGKVNGNRGGQA